MQHTARRRDGVPRLKALAATLTAVAALSGCGGADEPDDAPAVSDDQRGILDTVDALQSASRAGDARKICDEIFTETLARSIRKASKQSCQAEVRDTLTSPDAQLSVGQKIEVKGSRAKATVREQNGNTSTIELVKEGDRWRIERVIPVKPK
jgi:hypothetical protein